MTKATIFSLVIPCFNEELAVPSFLIELSVFQNFFLTQFPDIQLKILFVDNNSTDRSNQLLTAYCQARNNISILKCDTQGYGAALKFGFSQVQADYYGFVDLDQTYPLNDFLIGLSHMTQQKDLHMLMTNRFSNTSGMPWIRKMGNQFFALIVNVLFSKNVIDVCSGQRILSKNKIQQIIKLKDNGLNFSIELSCMAYKNNWNIFYMPIQYKERTGKSKLSIFKDGYSFLITVLRIKFIQ